MKFAVVEIKLAMIKLLRMFEINTCDKTSKKLELTEGIVRSPKESIILKFQKRSN